MPANFSDGYGQIDLLRGNIDLKISEMLDIGAKILKEEIDRATDKHVQKWTGTFKALTHITDKTKYTVSVINESDYGFVVEYGHNRQYFVPFSNPGGDLTELGKWAVDIVGAKDTGRFNPKGYRIFELGRGIATGMLVQAEGRAPFRTGGLAAEARIHDALAQFVKVSR